MSEQNNVNKSETQESAAPQKKRRVWFKDDPEYDEAADIAEAQALGLGYLSFGLNSYQIPSLSITNWAARMPPAPTMLDIVARGLGNSTFKSPIDIALGNFANRPLPNFFNFELADPMKGIREAAFDSAIGFANVIAERCPDFPYYGPAAREYLGMLEAESEPLESIEYSPAGFSIDIEFLEKPTTPDANLRISWGFGSGCFSLILPEEGPIMFERLVSGAWKTRMPLQDGGPALRTGRYSIRVTAATPRVLDIEINGELYRPMHYQAPCRSEFVGVIGAHGHNACFKSELRLIAPEDVPVYEIAGVEVSRHTRVDAALENLMGEEYAAAGEYSPKPETDDFRYRAASGEDPDEAGAPVPAGDSPDNPPIAQAATSPTKKARKAIADMRAALDELESSAGGYDRVRGSMMLSYAMESGAALRAAGNT